jgi:regulator of sigma E protease
VTYVLSFLLVLGVLIFVHELGHFLVARWYRVRVLTFSLGFGPKVLKLTRGGTEYCISAIPLGGYVKMAGETTQDEREGAADEFLSKSKWIRFQVYLAGPLMNILLAIVALTVVIAVSGANVPLWRSSPPVVGVVDEGSVAARAGIQPGDRIVSVNGRQMTTWDEFNLTILTRANRELSLVIDRAGEQLTLAVVPAAETKYDLGTLGVRAAHRPQVLDVHPDRPGERAGLQPGDVILAFAGQRGLNRQELVEQIRERAGQATELVIERTGREFTLAITPEGARGSAIIGITISELETRRIDPTLAEALMMSVQQNWDTTREIGTTVKGLFTRETPMNQLMGPIAIADLSGTAASLGWIELLNLMAMISLNLALLNLMPVPVLDGGQIAILALEGVARRDMSVRAKERFAMVGAAMIVLLMVTVLYNDIARIIR